MMSQDDTLPDRSRRTKVRVVLTVELPRDHGPVTEDLRADIAADVSEAVHERIPKARIHWYSVGGRVPDVVETAALNGRTVASQRYLDQLYGEA